MNTRPFLILALLTALALSGCSSSSKSGNDEYKVEISGFKFTPATITVTHGESVTFHNSDSATHTATADGGSFNTRDLANGASKSIRFDTAGTFAYHCNYHSQMTATVIVQ